MMDQARLFLYRVLPWHPVGDPSAYVNIHWTFQSAGYNRPAWSGRACISIDECIKTIQWAQRQPDTKDFYVCLSTQREYEARQARGGREVRIAVREQKNAHQHRAWTFDIDVKDGHHGGAAYISTKEALAAFLDFLKRSGIPRPTMFVHTGSGGLHVYWTINEAIDTATWQPIANALAEAARRFNLHADTACTVDAARVMRIPETKHSKHGKLAQLSIPTMLPYDYTLDQMRQALAPYMGAQVFTLNPRGNLNADLAGGIETPKAAPINIRSVAAAGCGFVREALDTGGAAYANPLWNLSTLLATFTEGGRDDAHAMALGHPNYTPAETDELFDRKTREKEEKNLGWPSCQSIENAGCTSCRTCPLKGPDTRPLQFGRPTQVPLAAQLAQRTSPGLPHGYSYDHLDRVCKVRVAESGATQLDVVIPYWVGNPWLQVEPWTLHFTARVRNDNRESNVAIQTSAFHSQEFGKIVGDAGFSLKPDQLKEFRVFLTSWQQELRNRRDAIVSAPAFGWVGDHKTTGFAYGGRMYSADGTTPSGKPDANIAAAYTPKGDLEPWREAAQMITELRQPERDVFVAAAFAGPLVNWAGQPGLILAGYSSDSGMGKTTALRIGQAVWGHPRGAVNGTNDTLNHVAGKMAQTRAIPIFWDEIKTDQQGQKFANLVFDVTGGKEKGRMTSEARIAGTGMWETMLVAANNASIVEEVQRANKTTTAGIFRVFEFVMPNLDTKISPTVADQMVLRLNHNYGQPGIVYAKFLGENVERVHKETVDRRAALEVTWEVRREERFWLCTCACLLQGAIYANELGLTSFDMPRMADFLRETFRAMRGEVSSAPVDMANKKSLGNTLGAYLAAMRSRHMLRTDKIHTGRGRPPAGSPFKVIEQDPSKLEDVRVHRGDQPAIMRFDATHFRDWLQKNGYSPHNVIDQMTRQWNMQKVNGILCGGTPYRAPMATWLYELDLTHPDLKDLVD